MTYLTFTLQHRVSGAIVRISWKCLSLRQLEVTNVTLHPPESLDMIEVQGEAGRTVVA